MKEIKDVSFEGANVPRRHFVLALFKGLSSKTRHTILGHALLNAKSYGVELQNSGAFRNIMADLDGAFVKWRYYYEAVLVMRARTRNVQGSRSK